MNIIEKIKLLEKESIKLDPEPERRNHWRTAVAAYSDNFLDNIEAIKAYVVTEDRGRDIYNTPIGEPKSIEQLLEVLAHNVDRPGPVSYTHLTLPTIYSV